MQNNWWFRRAFRIDYGVTLDPVQINIGAEIINIDEMSNVQVTT